LGEVEMAAIYGESVFGVKCKSAGLLMKTAGFSAVSAGFLVKTAGFFRTDLILLGNVRIFD